MQTPLEFIRAEAMQLTIEDRVELAERLYRSALNAPDFDARRKSEVYQCLAEIAAWRARHLSATEVMTSATANNPALPPDGD
jgi:hypothetical protein